MVMNLPIWLRPAMPSFRNSTAAGDPATLNEAGSDASTPRDRRRTSPDDSAVAETWSFQPWSGTRSSAGRTEIQGSESSLPVSISHCPAVPTPRDSFTRGRKDACADSASMRES
jgi:hypothetical protein